MRHREVGSIWGKWDLHLHTPASFDYENKSVTNAEIVDTLKKSEVQVVAITDHHVMDVERIRNLQALAKDDLTVLPGIEFRSELGGKEKVHLVGIFAEDCNLEDIWTKLSGKLDLTSSDLIYKGGDEKIYVDFKNAANVIRECGGIVTVHAGKKSNSIESIGNHEKFKMALKTDLAREFIDLFEVGSSSDFKAYQEIVFPAIGFAKPIIIGSDNHEIHKYLLSDPCWIKGDPSFRTFQQLKSEPGRAFIGAIPDEMRRVQANKTKYISRVNFKKVENSKLDEDWFSGTVPINSGLVAIIGNKGTGKTALAESIGLLGNCEVSRAFSFLSDKKFRQPGNNKAREFKAQLVWESGHKVAHYLSDSTNDAEPQLISYIPQNYLETICNELENRPGSQFDRELKSVIFSHVPEDKRLGATALDELLAFTNERLEERLKTLRWDLHDINELWWILKQESSIHQRQVLANLLANKERELQVLEKTKPTDVPKPGTDPQKQVELDAIGKEIDERNREHAAVIQKIKDSEALKRSAEAQIASATRVLQTLSNFRATYTSLLQNLQTDCKILEIDPATLVTIDINSAPVTKLSKDSFAASTEQDTAIAAFAKESSALKGQVQLLTAKLDAPNIAFQSYLQAVTSWEEQRSAVIGDNEIPDTIKYFKNKIEGIKNIPNQIADIEKQRDSKVEEIYATIESLVENYRLYYSPVQRFIAGHRAAKDKFKLEFNASIFADDLAASFLGRVNQGRKGSFCGLEEGQAVVSGLLTAADLQSVKGVQEFTLGLLDRLEYDYRFEPKSSSSLNEQLLQHVDPVEMLDFIFGLEYLSPRYQLRWTGKNLHELSPGERGALLLIFYLLIDRRDIPLLIDQPEENLDNETVFDTLVPCLQEARKRRQVIIVTHNPNLAVVCDADQIIHAQIDKQNRNKVTYVSGGIESPEMNQFSIAVLEGTRPAFDKRDSKYQA